MVRRNELACRDEWSRSLWQPRDGRHSNGDMPFQRSVSGPLPPALAENVHSVLNGDKPLAASPQGEDVLLSEARIISEAHDPWEPSERPFPTGHFDPRTAIFRAREAYRERVRIKAAAERQSAAVEAIIEYPSVSDIPSVQPEQSTAETVDQAPHERAVAAEFPDQTFESHWWLAEPVEEESQVDAAALPAVEAISENTVPDEFVPFADELRLTEPEVGGRATARTTEHTGMLASGTPAIEEDRSATARPELVEQEVLPDWYRADLPRICRTCRDYRPSAEGQRGWCANSWAFTHLRLVLEDDPAPCQSATGDWWLPVDDVWLVAADVSSHGRTTPLLDRLTAKVDHQRRRS